MLLIGPWYLIVFAMWLTHWGRVTHICVSNLTTIGWDNGLSPGRRQAIISTNDRILLIGPLGTNFNQNSYIFIQENVLEIIVCKMAAILSRSQCVKSSITLKSYKSLFAAAVETGDVYRIHLRSAMSSLFVHTKKLPSKAIMTGTAAILETCLVLCHETAGCLSVVYDFEEMICSLWAD